jgi:hypothetical protein
MAHHFDADLQQQEAMPGLLNMTSIGCWTAQKLMSMVNVTKHVPSFDDLIWAGPRMIRKLSPFVHFPDGPNSLRPGFSLLNPGSESLESAGMLASNINGLVGSNLNTPSATTAEAAGGSSRATFDGPKGLTSIFGYVTSKWALCCIAMAIVLNRAYIFAATRRRLVLPWQTRLVIRSTPLILLLLQARQLLQSIQCQTSTGFSEMHWGSAGRSAELGFSYPNEFLHGLSSLLLFNPSDKESCHAIGMLSQSLAQGGEYREPRGSSSLLWPLFGTFCLSQLVETISCAVEGRPLSAETGLTLFEHSLAFAEADAAISNLGLGILASGGLGSSTMPPDRYSVTKNANTTPEVLLVALLSTMAHITSHILAVLNLQARFRLLSTAFWGLCFMTCILWSAVSFSLGSTGTQSLLRFPTVCVIGFIPHVVVLSGIALCFSVYGFALVLSVLVPPPGHETSSTNWRQRLAQARANLQASVLFPELRLSREIDFYTALLRTGFSVMKLASEAVFLNEDSAVATPHSTWLEEQHLRQLEAYQGELATALGDEHRHNFGAGISSTREVIDARPTFCNGFALERSVPNVQKRRRGLDQTRGDGIGTGVRSARWLLAMDYLLRTNRLFFRLGVTVVLKGLEKLGIRLRPLWLLRLSGSHKAEVSDERSLTNMERSESQEDSLPLIPGFRIRRSDTVDVEVELRTHIESSGTSLEDMDEGELDNQLYAWWLDGRAWGLEDMSGDYAPSEGASDADCTSVASSNRSDCDPDDLGHGNVSRSSRALSSFERDASPLLDTPIQTFDLARLIRPQNAEDQDEADTLSAHLASEDILTRSRYRRVKRLQLARVLATGPLGTPLPLRPARLSHTEEAKLLEQILMSRRRLQASEGPSLQNQGSWTSGASGMGAEGPQCVVCQSTPRTIIMWPCRCLSLCDDCRVALAMNNFDRCVCCRREVSSFSKIYVP